MAKAKEAVSHNEWRSHPWFLLLLGLLPPAEFNPLRKQVTQEHSSGHLLAIRLF